MTLSQVKIFAFVLAVFVASAKFCDFMLGKKGRDKLREHVIFRPWYRLESLSLFSPIWEGSHYFHTFIAKLGTKLGASAFIWYGGTVTLLAFFLKYKMGLGTGGSYFLYSNRKELDSRIIALVMIFSCAATSLSVAAIVKRKALSRAIVLWLGNILFIAAVVRLIDLDYRSDSRFATGLAKPIEFGNGMEFPLGVLIYAPAVALPCFVHSLFIGGVFCLCIGEYWRRFFVILIERIDESNSSPLTLIATFVSGVAALVGLGITTFAK